jgi:hypothetical protein
MDQCTSISSIIRAMNRLAVAITSVALSGDTA